MRAIHSRKHLKKLRSPEISSPVIKKSDPSWAISTLENVTVFGKHPEHIFKTNEMCTSKDIHQQLSRNSDDANIEDIPWYKMRTREVDELIIETKVRKVPDVIKSIV